MIQRDEISDSFYSNVYSQSGVRILLVGDPGSGKTSLIHSLINDDFDPNLPPKLNDVTIPANIAPDHVPIHITDYSIRDESYSEIQLSQATDDADVICIVYVAGDHASLLGVASNWLPTLKNFDKIRGSYRPIILVANKIDLIPDESLSEGVASIRQIFLNVEAHIEVSAKTQKNVVELFVSAQKAITYPIAPIFDTQTRTLTKKCREALSEIFKSNDIDRDGLLNDIELKIFHEYCFGAPIQGDSLDDLKQVIKQSTVDGIANDAITLNGFLFLHELSIEKGKRYFTWQVLRKYNYGSRLEAKTSIENSSLVTTMVQDGTTNSITATYDKSNDESICVEESLSSVTDESETQLNEINTAKQEKSTKQLMNTFDIPWLKQNPKFFKAGLGITVTTFISFIALRYLSTSKN